MAQKKANTLRKDQFLMILKEKGLPQPGKELVTEGPFVLYLRRRKLNKYIKEWEEKVVQDIEKLRSKDAKQYWNRLKKMNQREEEKRSAIPKKVRNEENELVEGTAMVKVWEESFRKLGMEDLSNKEFEEKFATEVRKFVQELEEKKDEKADDIIQILNKPIEREEVSKAIRKLKRGKAVGIDRVGPISST